MSNNQLARTIIVIATAFDGTSPMPPGLQPTVDPATGIETLTIGGVVGQIPASVLGIRYAGFVMAVSNSGADPGAQVSTVHLGNAVGLGQTLRTTPTQPLLLLPGASVLLQHTAATRVELVCINLDRPDLVRLVVEPTLRIPGSSGPFPNILVQTPSNGATIEPIPNIYDVIFSAAPAGAFGLNVSNNWNLGAGGFYVRNEGAGTITLTPPGGATINGAATATIAANSTRYFVRTSNTQWLGV
jgi:hypothetical protein